MEMQEGRAPDVADSWWNELPEDFQMEILAWLPVESVYRYAIVCKEWNELLSSNDFITRWAKTPSNGEQPRLLLCDWNPKMPCMAFCFSRRTWIKSCFTLSFLYDWALPDWPNSRSCMQCIDIHCSTNAVTGLLLVRPFLCPGRLVRLCNPYTHNFVDIPQSNINAEELRCVVVDENNKDWPSETAFKVVVVGHASPDVMERRMVEVFESSQNRWNIAGYIGEDILIPRDSQQLVFWNGSFYTHCYWRMPVFRRTSGIVAFTIPLERNGSAATPIPILLVSYPEILRNAEDPYDIECYPHIITCGSRLLLIAAIKLPVEQLGKEGVVIMWEFQIEEDRPVHPANTPSWKWVEIARMPPSLFREWKKKMFSPDVFARFHYLNTGCTGVGDHVCFVPSLSSPDSPLVEVLTYNLVDNTWNWLPSCPKSHRCGGEVTNCRGGRYMARAFKPIPHVKLE